MTKHTKQKKDASFASAFQELEDIVKKFEDGKLDLDESLEYFERGLELASVCKKHLAHIENKVIDIKKKFSKDELFEENE